MKSIKTMPTINMHAMHDNRPLNEDVAPVAWFEGLQLLPQHFQVWDRRIERLLHRYGAGCFSYHWGVDDFSFDPSALAGGKLRVLTASGQFPDGLVFGYNAHNYRALEYAFGGGEVKMPLRLALAVPVSDFDAGAGAVRRHYQHFGAPIADSANPDQKVSIAKLAPNITIRPWEEGVNDYSQLAVIEIVATPRGYEVTPFHPAAIRIIRESQLEKDVFSIAVGLRRAAEFVKGRPVPHSLSGDYVNGHGWILSCLVSGLSTLEGLMGSHIAHPYDIYLALCGIAGGIAPIAGVIPPYFPPYDHMDPAASVNTITGFISGVIPTLIPTLDAWRGVPFEGRAGGGAWRLSFPEYYKRKSAVVVFKFSEPDSGDHVSSLLEGSLICYSSQVANFREQRVRGLPRKMVESVPEIGLVSDATQKLLLIEGLDVVAAMEDSLIIEIARGAGKTAIASISLVVPNE